MEAAETAAQVCIKPVCVVNPQGLAPRLLKSVLGYYVTLCVLDSYALCSMGGVRSSMMTPNLHDYFLSRAHTPCAASASCMLHYLHRDVNRSSTVM